MLTLLSLSSLSFTQPVSAATRPTYGRLRVSDSIMTYPQLPTTRHQLKRGRFTRVLAATTFELRQPQRGIGGLYFHIINGHFNGWIPTKTVMLATSQSINPSIKIIRIRNITKKLLPPTNATMWLNVSTRHPRLITNHQFSGAQIRHLRLHFTKHIWTNHGQFDQVSGNHGFSAWLPSTNPTHQLTLTQHSSKRKSTRTRASQQPHLVTKTPVVMKPINIGSVHHNSGSVVSNNQPMRPAKSSLVTKQPNQPLTPTQPHSLQPSQRTRPASTSLSMAPINTNSHLNRQPASATTHHQPAEAAVKPAVTVRPSTATPAPQSQQAALVRPTPSAAPTPRRQSTISTTVQPVTPQQTTHLGPTPTHNTSQIGHANKVTKPIGASSPTSAANNAATSQVPSTAAPQRASTSGAAANSNVASASSSATQPNASAAANIPAAHSATPTTLPSYRQNSRKSGPTNASSSNQTTQSAVIASSTHTQPTQSAAASTTPHLVAKYTAQQALQAINQLITANHFMGTLLITNNGPAGTKTLTFGSANLSQHIANTTDEAYPLASLEKSVTGAVIQHLINAGKLTMNTTLAHFYPQLPYAQSITIRQLLDHTSGIQMGEPVPAQALTSDQQAVAFTLNHLTSTNQHHWSYSNANFTLLAGIVDQLTGQSFSANVQADILQPLNLQHTFTYDQVPTTAVHPLPYTFTNGTTIQRSISTNLLSSELGCGNLYASVGDFYTFIHNLVNGQLLTPAGFRELADNLQPVYSGGIYYRSDGTIRIGGADNSLYSLYIGSNDSKIAMVFFANQAKWATMNTVGVQIEQILAQSATI